MNIRIFHMIIMILLMTVSHATAEGVWTHFIGDGIPTEVRSMAVDHDGVLWVGGRPGLSSYDGVEWTTWWLADLSRDEWLIYPGDDQPMWYAWPRDIAVDTDNVKWFAIYGGVVRYDGDTWEFIRKDRPEEGRPELFMSAVVDRNNVKWFGTAEHGVWSYDGASWTNYYSDISEYPRDAIIAVDSNNTKWIAYYQDAIQEMWNFVSYNDTTWTRYSENNYGAARTIAADSHDVIWISAYGSDLCRFDGKELIKHFGSEYMGNDARIGQMAIGPDDVVWIDTIENGVIRYDGASWTTFDTTNGLVDNRVSTIFIDENNIKWFGTYTGVSRLIENSVEVENTPKPAAIAIIGNYPNPFNPTTTIEYILDTDAYVTLEIYDITGRKVATLVDDYRDMGLHTATFDGSNLASGLYFYRLHSNSFSDTGKLMIVK